MKTLSLFVLIAVLFQTVSAQDAAQKKIFIANPYLQIGKNPTSTTLQLLWQTEDESAEWKVEQRDGKENKWRKTDMPAMTRLIPVGGKHRRLYETTFRGLSPGEAFSYRVYCNGKIIFSSVAHAPKSSDQPFRFVAFGDIGAGTPEQKPLATRVHVEKPDLVVVAGDIVYDHGLISEYDTKFWPVYNANQTDKEGAPLMCSIPFVAAPGNHDTDTRNLDQFPDALAYFLYWKQPLNGPQGVEGSALVPPLIASDVNRKAFVDAAGASYPVMANFSFNFGNAHWTFLDSNPYVDFSDASLANWVAADLAKSKDAMWHFVVFHHPGFNSAREHYEQQQMRLLSPVFEAGKVDVVFNGHVHNYQRSFPLQFVPDRAGTLLMGGRENKSIRGRVVNGRWKLDKLFDGKTNTKPEGVIYVVTGAGGQDLYNPEQNDDPDSWQKFTDKFVSIVHSLTVVDVDGKVLRIRQVTAEGKELDNYIITK